MSSRAEQKQRLREERLKAEEAERARAARGRRLGILGGVVGIAIVAVVVALVISGGGKDEVTKPKAETADLFQGIPQKGLTIGNANAPVTVEEFLDLQCPVCQRFSQAGLPTLINDYVRTGKVKLTMRPIAILGDDSKTAADAAFAASKVDKAWNFAETFYANQGVENSGYVTDDFLTDVVKATPGGLSTSIVAGRNADDVQQLFDETAKRQNELGVNSTPTFYAEKGDGKPQQLQINPDDPASISAALDPIVGSAN